MRWHGMHCVVNTACPRRAGSSAGECRVDGHLRPAVRRGFDTGNGDGLIRPQLGADLGALRVLPDEIERSGRDVLARQRRPRLRPDPRRRSRRRCRRWRRFRSAPWGSATRSRRRRAPRACRGPYRACRRAAPAAARRDRSSALVGDVGRYLDRRRVGTRQQLGRRVALLRAAERRPSRCRHRHARVPHASSAITMDSSARRMAAPRIARLLAAL